MATKTDFSVQLGQPTIVGVDPSSATQAIKLQGAATAEALKFLGSTAFDAFAGYQAEGFKQEQKEILSGLQSAMAEVKQGDITNKAQLEQGLARLSAEQESFRASAILANADPEEARKSATIFAQQKEAPILAKYRAEQQRLVALREQMPEKEKEADLRSEALLKSYMARYPGFSSTFRSISQEVTGKKNLEMYSVQQLYKEIDFIEKQKESAAKVAAKAEEDAQKAFIKDATTGGRMSETQALELYKTLPASQRLRIANNQVAIDRLEKDAEAELKKGGTGLQNFVTGRISTFRERSVQASATAFSQLKALGITEEQMIGGTIPPEKRYDPAVKTALEKATQSQLNLLDAEFTSAQAELRKKMANPIDASMARQAEADLTSWYTSAKDDLIKNGIGKSLSAFSSNEDEKTMRERITAANSLQQLLNIHPDIAQQFANQATMAQARQTYPGWAAGLDHIDKMRRAAMRGVSTGEWLKLQEEFSKINVNNPKVPQTPVSVATSIISYKNLGRKLEDVSQNLGTETISEVVPSFVNSSMASPDNLKDALTKYPTALAESIRKLPASEKEIIVGQVQQISNNYLYGSIGHGDAAKKAYESFKTSVLGREKVPYSTGVPALAFNDQSGNQALSISVSITPDPAIVNNPMQMGEFKRNVDKFSKATNVNNILQAVDNTIRLRAVATGESVVALRKEFMTTFMKEGLPSANSTTLVIPPAPAADNVQPTPGGSLVTPSTVTDANVGNLRVPGSKTEFQKFATREEGVQAMSKQLEIYGTRDKIDTLRSAISKWAPPNENDTEAYIKFVSARTGIGADEKIDLTDPAVRTIIMGPMMIMEKGKKSFVRAQ